MIIQVEPGLCRINHQSSSYNEYQLDKCVQLAYDFKWNRAQIFKEGL